MAHERRAVSFDTVLNKFVVQLPCSSPPPKLTTNPLLWIKHLLTPYTAAEKDGLARTERFYKYGCGYYYEQSTQPQTLGYSLADSPVGMLAWIYEKLVNWTDSYPWTDDEGETWSHIMSKCIYIQHYHSADMDLDLLVLSSWACRKCQNLLRVHK